MTKLKKLLEQRTRGELTLLAILAAIALFAAGIKVGEFLAVTMHAG